MFVKASDLNYLNRVNNQNIWKSWGRQRILQSVAASKELLPPLLGPQKLEHLWDSAPVAVGKAFGIRTAISLPPPQSDDLNAPQLSVIRATPYNSCHERNAHAHKTKRGEEKGDSDAEIKVG